MHLSSAYTFTPVLEILLDYKVFFWVCYKGVIPELLMMSEDISNLTVANTYKYMYVF